MRYAFACTRCGLVLDDGVDYTWCPKCGGTVTRIEPRPMPKQVALPSVPVMARFLLVALLVVQAVLALFAPHAFPHLAVWLFVAQVCALALVAAVVVVSPQLRVLARDKRIRILHGLEHATINLMIERGFPVTSGCTYERTFVIHITHDGRSWNRLDEIRTIAKEAIDRIARGEHALAYSPLCGTSWLVGYCLLAVAVVGCGFGAWLLHVPTGITFASTVAAGLVACALKRPLGLWVQRHLSVSTDLLAGKVEALDATASADGNTLVITIAMDVTPKTRARRGGTVSPLFG